jgi:hypothetical protein
MRERTGRKRQRSPRDRRTKLLSLVNATRYVLLAAVELCACDGSNMLLEVSSCSFGCLFCLDFFLQFIFLRIYLPYQLAHGIFSLNKSVCQISRARRAKSGEDLPKIQFFSIPSVAHACMHLSGMKLVINIHFEPVK